MRPTAVTQGSISRMARMLVVFLAASATLIVSGAARSEGGGTLTIRCSGLEETTGELIVSVANSREMFESEEQALLVAEPPVRGKQESAVFEGVAPGEYAVKVFHDANSNRELDFGLMGPKEKFGFSNNVMGFMGPPDYDDAKFVFDGTTLVVEIEAR